MKNACRRLDAVDPLVGLADPVEPGRRVTGRVHLPIGTGRDETVTARTHVVLLTVNGDAQFTLHQEKHTLGAGVGLGVLTTAAGRHLDDVLRERLGETRERAGNHPQPGVVPERQQAGDDVAHRPSWQHRVGLGEHRAVRCQFGLTRQATGRGVVGSAS